MSLLKRGLAWGNCLASTGLLNGHLGSAGRAVLKRDWYCTLRSVDNHKLNAGALVGTVALWPKGHLFTIQKCTVGV